MSDWIAPERLVMAATRRVIPWLFTSFRSSSIWSLRCSSSITSWCLFSFFSSQSRNVWANTYVLRIMVEPMLLLLTFLHFELESCISLDFVLDESDFSRIKQCFQNDQKHKALFRRRKWKGMKRIILEYFLFPLFGSFNRVNGKSIPLFESLSGNE